MNFKTIVCLGAILILASCSIAETIIVDADNTGWYNDRGTHWGSNDSNTTGKSFKSFIGENPEYSNSYFVFTVPEIPLEITKVVLCLELTYYTSNDPYEDVKISSVSTPVDELVADHYDSYGIYNDLMDGPELAMWRIPDDALYGDFDNEKTLLYCTLNELGKNLVTEASGGQFAIGLSLVDMTGESFQYLGFNSGYGDSTVRTHQLHITTVPEPAAMVLLTIGAFFLNRRKTNQ